MNYQILGVLYGLAGLLFILAGGFTVRPLKAAVQRWGWILLGVANLGLAGVMGLRIYLAGNPAQVDPLEILTAGLALLLGGLSLAACLVLGRRFVADLQFTQAKQKEAERFQASFDRSPNIAILKDLRGVYLSTNQAYQLLLGKKEENLAGESDFKFFPRAQANGFKLEDEKVIASAQASIREEEIHGADGAHWFRITRLPLVDGANAVTGLLVTGQDITGQKAAERAQANLAQKISVLYEAEKALGEPAAAGSEWEGILTWAEKLGGTQHVGVWQIVPEHSTALWAAGSGKLAGLDGTQVRAGAELVWKAWQTQQTEFAPDYRPDSSGLGWIVTESYSAALGLPLFLNGRVVFVLTLFFEQPNFSMSEEEVQLFTMFGQIASLSLQYKERSVGYQSEIAEWQHKLDKQAAQHQAEIADWQRKTDDLEARRQTDIQVWSHKLDVQAAAHQAEIEEWYQKLGDRNAVHQAEVEDWKRKVDAVQYRARLEHIVGVIAAHMISVDHEKVDEAINRSLQTMAKFSGVDRDSLVLFASHPALGPDQPAWYGFGVNPSAEHEEDFSGGEFQWGLDRLNQMETIHIPRVADLNDARDEPAAYLKSRGVKSYTAIPLVSNRSVIGYLGLEALRTELDWSPEILALLKVFADMLVNLLERKWAAQALEADQEKTNAVITQLVQRNQEAGLMTEMGDLLQACRTADEAYPIIIRYTQRLLPSGSGALYMLHDPKDPAENVASWGANQPGPAEHELALNECWALRRGRIYTVQDPTSEPVCSHIKDSIHAGYMCVPLIAQGVAVGVLHLRLPENVSPAPSFSENHQRLAAKVGEYIAIPLTNLKLRDELRSQAIRDPLTGLFNRRYMEETLDREIRRAGRHSTSVGVIMFDIDRMKPINDRFGHDAGDLALRTLGKELQSLFRGEDVACRYGGDEFTIVLPEATLSDVWRRAEQLREAARRLEVKYDGKQVGPITLSIGVAAFPDHGQTAERVLLACDAASYASKSEGGDRIMMGHKVDA